jgi:putative tricarboxylic transport membrane protein
MRRYYQVTALSFLALSIYVMVQSRFTYLYYTEYGPGPGFLPFWCAFILGGTSLAWFLQVSFRPVEDKPVGFIPSGAAATRVFSAIIALAVFTFLMPYLGFQLPLMAFLFVLLITLGRQRLLSTVILSVGGSWGITYLFRTLLELPLPMSAFEFLKNLGF